MTEINSFPINTITYEDLDPITDAQATDSDGVLFFDESVGVMKRMTRGELFKGKVIPINSIADFPNLLVDTYDDRQQFHLNSFAPDGSSGGGPLMWAPDKPKSLHDGIRYFSPTVPIPADFNNVTDVQNYMDGVGEEFPTADGIFELTLYSIQSSEFPSIDGSFAIWDGPSGNQLKNGVVPSAIGLSALQIPNISEVGYARFNADETISMRTLVEHKTDLQLNNVDNTSDADKPVSIATQTEIDLKAPLASPSLTGTPTAPTAAANTNTEQLATTAFVQGELADRIQSVETIADLRLIDGVSVGQVFNVNGIGLFEAVSGAFTDDGILFVNTANGVRCKILNGIVASAASVYVPSYYATIQAAIDDLHPRVKTVSGARINVLIEAGHEITAGLFLQFGDYSNFQISSVDPTVYLATGFTFVTSNNSIFAFSQCHAPDLNIKVDAGGEGGRAVVYLSARGKVGQQGGALNAGTDALYMNSGAIVTAHRTVWDGAGRRGAWISRVSLFDGEDCSFSNCNEGMSVRRGSRANITNSVLNNNTTTGLSVTRSYVNFQGREDAVSPILAQANGNGANGVVVVRGSVATLTGLKANNNGSSGVQIAGGAVVDFDFGEAIGNAVGGLTVQGGTASAVDSTLTGNNRNIIAIGANATVDADGADVSNATAANVQCYDGASVNLANATGNNAGTIGIDVRDGGTVAAPDAVFNDAGLQGALCNSGTLNAPRAQFRRAGTTGVRVTGATVYLTNGNCQRVDGVSGTSDIDFSNGSTVHANGTLGGYPAAVTPNTISGARGILYGA